VPKLIVFDMVSLDGFFVDARGDMSWAKSPAPDPEYQAFVEGNASGGGVLLFGRITYELMAGYWPTPLAARNDPVVARRMNDLPKVVFSRTLAAASWSNTRLVRDDLAGAVRTMKRESGPGLAILGSGSIVSQLTQAGLIDEYQIVVVPVVLGAGRTLFEGGTERRGLVLAESRAFANGNVLLRYHPSA